MLAVVAPTATTTTTTTTTTSTTGPHGLGATHLSYLPTIPAAISGNTSSVSLLQGDQPAPPLIEGTPVLPSFWKRSTNRTLYLNNRYGRYLEMWPDGETRGVPIRSSFCIFVVLSHLSHVVMKGYISEKYLCMDPSTFQLYSRNHVHQDCFIQEAIRSGNIVYSFAHCRTPQNRKCYLDMYPNGTMRLGSEARQSRSTAQWLAKEVAQEELKLAADDRDRMKKEGVRWTPPPLPTPVTAKEQRRKRVRRWCRNLDIIVKNPRKFRRRCKHDCDILERMIRQPKRYLRRCLMGIVRRRLRNKYQPGDPVSAFNTSSVRAKVQQLWPQRKEIFQRLRQIRRCNKKKEKSRRLKEPQKRSSCSIKDIRRQQKRRAERRRRTKEDFSTLDSEKPSSRSLSTSAKPGKRRIRHLGRKRGRKRVEGGVHSTQTYTRPGVDSAQTHKNPVDIKRRKRRSTTVDNDSHKSHGSLVGVSSAETHETLVDIGRRKKHNISVGIGLGSRPPTRPADAENKNKFKNTVNYVGTGTASHSKQELATELT